MAFSKWIIVELVQGVGARPRVFNQAKSLGLTGSIKNTRNGLDIELSGDSHLLEAFDCWLKTTFEPESDQILRSDLAPDRLVPSDLQIVNSSLEMDGHQNYPLAPDRKICEECATELFIPGNRRYRYPFISCSECGPRFSLQSQLPYDRQNTSWNKFPPCLQCQSEYSSQDNRRFHQQAISCPQCGPSWFLKKFDETAECFSWNDIGDIATHISSGGVLALQGTGSVHLVGLATNENAINKIRQLKQRPFQPLALLFPDVEQIHEYCDLNEQELQTVTASTNPILITNSLTKNGKHLAQTISKVFPNSLGIFLPTNGSLSILSRLFPSPLICTSANLHNEPTPITPEKIPLSVQKEVWTLHHNLNPQFCLEDSVVQQIGTSIQGIRRARGFAPKPVPLPYPLKVPTIALGGDLQNTVAFGIGKNVFLSPHLGDQQSPINRERAIEFLTHITRHFSCDPERILMDAHPGYHSRNIANYFPNSQRTEVFHHRAHASQVLAENHIPHQPVLVATFDGTGYGEDHSTWGSELFLGAPNSPHRLKRIGCLTPFSLPPNLEQSQSTSFTTMGRAFDAVAAILNLGTQNSFEGDLPMRVMTQAQLQLNPPPSPIKPILKYNNGLLEWDIQSFLNEIHHRFKNNDSVPALSFLFHQGLVDFVLMVAKETEAKAMALSGGCFANTVLCNLIKNQSHFPVFFPTQTPPGDGGLSFGQLAYQAFKDHSELT